MRVKGRQDKFGAAALLVMSSMMGAGLAVSVFCASTHATWSTIALGRLLAGLALALLLARSVGASVLVIPERWGWWRMVASGLGVPAGFFAYASLRPSDAAAIMQLGPLWAVFLQAMLLRRRPPRFFVIAVLLAFIGVVCIHGGSLGVLGLAAAAAHLNAMCRGLGIVAAGRVTRTPATVLVFQATIGALASTVILFSLSSGTAILSGSFVLLGFWIVVVAVFATLSNVFASRALQLGATHSLAPLLYLTPAFAIIVESIFLSHPPTLLQVVGVSLIVAASTGTVVIGKRVKHAVVVPSAVGVVKRQEFEPIAQRFISETESRALVEVRVHVESGDASPRRTALSLFEALGVSSTRRGNGALVVFFPDSFTIVVVLDFFLEQRIPSNKLAAACMEQSVERVLDALRNVFVQSVPGEREDVNELPDEVTFGGI